MTVHYKKNVVPTYYYDLLIPKNPKHTHNIIDNWQYLKYLNLVFIFINCNCIHMPWASSVAAKQVEELALRTYCPRSIPMTLIVHLRQS